MKKSSKQLSIGRSRETKAQNSSDVLGQHDFTGRGGGLAHEVQKLSTVTPAKTSLLQIIV